MKFTTMFTKFYVPLILALTILIFLVACKGEVGPKGDSGVAGAVGATGPTGASGVAGATGPTGNANVIQISYPGRTVLGSFSLSLPGVTAEIIDKSQLFTYVKSNCSWYQIHGYTGYAIYEYRTYITPSTPSTLYVIRMDTPTPGADIFEAIRVLVIQANTIVKGCRASVDYNNYQEVKAYYNLTD